MLTRRQIIETGIAAIGGLALSSLSTKAFASTPGFDLTTGSRVLNLYRPESGERLHLEYLRNGKWVGDAYTRLCWLMRDIQTNESAMMDLSLIAAMDWIQQYLRRYGYGETIHLTSAYRSKTTNSNTEGAAKDSEHTKGKAIDFRIPKLGAEYTGKLVKYLAAGGVGVYDNNRAVHRQFVHMDTGRMRTWRG